VVEEGEEPRRDGLCTKHVLVMDKLSGESVHNWGMARLKEMAEKLGYESAAALKNDMMTWTAAETQAKLGNPPDRLTMQRYLRALEWKDRLIVWAMCCWDFGVVAPAKWVCALFGWQPTVAYAGPRKHKTKVPNIYEVKDLLYEAYAHLLMKHGIVNGDPHAGNVMLLGDNKLGLIDWGQLRVLSADKVTHVERLLFAVGARDEEKTVDYMLKAGFQSELNNPWIINLVAQVWFGGMSDEAVVAPLGGFARWDENANRLDKFQRLFDEEGDIVLAARECLLLSVTCRSLGLRTIDSAREMMNFARAELAAISDESVLPPTTAEDGEPVPAWKGGVDVRGRTLPESVRPDLSKIII